METTCQVQGLFAIFALIVDGQKRRVPLSSHLEWIIGYHIISSYEKFFQGGEIIYGTYSFRSRLRYRRTSVLNFLIRQKLPK